MSDTKPREWDVLFGMAVDALTLDEVVALIQVSLRTRQRMQIGVVNAAKLLPTPCEHGFHWYCIMQNLGSQPPT